MAEYFIVLKKGQEIVSEIIDFCKNKNIRSAYFSAIGAVLFAEIGFYDIHKKRYVFKEFNCELEITNITGNIATMDDELILHAHGTFSDKEMVTVGGHLKSAKVAGTCEVMIQTTIDKMVRKFDKETGLNLLNSLVYNM